MPLFFFFISGNLFKIDYINHPYDFIKRCIKSCYAPFIKYGLLFLLTHEILVSLGFMQHYATHDYIERLLYIMAFTGIEKYLGPFWFLIYMFFASVIFIVFTIWGSAVFRHIIQPENKHNIVISGGIFLSTCVMMMLDIFNCTHQS